MSLKGTHNRASEEVVLIINLMNNIEILFFTGG